MVLGRWTPRLLKLSRRPTALYRLIRLPFVPHRYHPSYPLDRPIPHRQTQRSAQRREAKIIRTVQKRQATRATKRRAVGRRGGTWITDDPRVKGRKASLHANAAGCALLGHRRRAEPGLEVHHSREHLAIRLDVRIRLDVAVELFDHQASLVQT